MTRYTDIVAAPSLRYIDDFMHVMRGVLDANNTIKVSVGQRVRGHRPLRIWILESERMLSSLPVVIYERWQKTKAELYISRLPGCELIVVSDWR